MGYGSMQGVAHLPGGILSLPHSCFRANLSSDSLHYVLQPTLSRFAVAHPISLPNTTLVSR